MSPALYIPIVCLSSSPLKFLIPIAKHTNSLARRDMAMAMAALLLLVLLAVPAVHSVQTNIPWNEGINYTNWAAGKTFTVDDTLGI